MNHHGSVNRIYRLVWNQVRSTWVPVAETAKGRGKSGRARAMAGRNALATAISLALAPLVHASPPASPCVAPACGVTAVGATNHPLGGQVVSGTGSITQLGNTINIRQLSPDLSIDWLSFNIGSQETVDFLQPSASAIAVNRIAGNSGSEILGHLDANGQVYLINPNGVLFGQGAQVNVGGLVASTLDTNDPSLTSSTQSFSGLGTGSIVNQGTITAANGGYVALIGDHVSNQGVITAQLGTVALGAGSAVTLDFSGNRLIHLQVDQSTLNNLAANNQLIQADGGVVIMTAGARRSLLASVVNNSGMIEARTVENHNGTIELLGGMTAGTVNVAGTLDASAPEGGNGGFIETNGTHVEVANGTRVTTAAVRGLTGSWLVDPQDYTIAPSGGDITGATLSSELGTTSVTLLSSSGAKAGSGNINVDDTVSWSANTLTLTAADNINVNAVMTASGSASLAMNPATANGADAAVPKGSVVMGLNGGGFIGQVNFSGTGTLSISGNAYTVINSLGAPGSTTGTDLQGIQGNLSGYYALGSNIDATATASWNSGAGFTPIATFTGILDGLGHTISNLTIDLPTPNVGLFGTTGLAAVIGNVGLIGGTVSGSGDVGGLVGTNRGLVTNSYATGGVSGSNYGVGGLAGGNLNSGTISNSYAAGSVSSTSKDVGGLVGDNVGTVVNSHATGAVSGTTAVGGLVGYGFHDTVSNSYATGNVSGASTVGGLVGYGLHDTVSNSYATGTVSGSSDLGGLVGANEYGTVSNSYATGNVSGTGGGYVGGLVGRNYGAIGNSYATGSVSGGGNSEYVGGLVGWNSGIVDTSYSTGSVSGSNYVGGLVGANIGSIANSYSAGSVGGSAHAGGLVGFSSYGSTVSNSFWDVTTSGQAASGGGFGMTTANMQTQANFTSATAVNGNVSPAWDFLGTWVMYNGYSYPLLRALMTPLTVTANNAAVTYHNSGFSGGNGVTYSVPITGNLYGVASYSGTSQGAVSVGNYVITPSGLYSDQQGYIIGYANGTLTIDRLASVMWTGGSSGNWSDAANWAGDAIPNYSNVAAVKIPKGDTVTYDSGMASLGTTTLTSLTSKGELIMAAGSLTTTGNLTTAGFEQSGGTLDVGGRLTITSTAGGVTLGDISAGSLNINSAAGAITQLASTAIEVATTTSLTASNGNSITLDNGNSFGGPVTSSAASIDLENDLGTLTLGNTTAGTLTVRANGAIEQSAGSSIAVTGTSTLNGDAIKLGNTRNIFTGAVTADFTRLSLYDATALTVSLDGRGASLISAGPMIVSGYVRDGLTTVTTGSDSSTTFGDTEVYGLLNVTSTGAVATAASLWR